MGQCLAPFFGASRVRCLKYMGEDNKFSNPPPPHNMMRVVLFIWVVLFQRQGPTLRHKKSQRPMMVTSRVGWKHCCLLAGWAESEVRRTTLVS